MNEDPSKRRLGRGLAALIGVIAVVALLVAVAKAKIGGQTGDILGASQQLTEAATLCLIAARLI